MKKITPNKVDYINNFSKLLKEAKRLLNTNKHENFNIAKEDINKAHTLLISLNKNYALDYIQNVNFTRKYNKLIELYEKTSKEFNKNQGMI
ncbi:hypothetical protein [Clostridium akagii]|uniref:hypothetical protein n=1 Tax=Clostridium akagii TaxID=91623 RepID=UPI00047D1705|nr:hypothetical protein [Clostridium akagii]